MKICHVDMLIKMLKMSMRYSNFCQINHNTLQFIFWKTTFQFHPFREGNTRTVISFIALLEAHLQIEIDYTLFEKHAAYVRNALVWASQGIYSNYEYLEHIFYDAAGVAVAISKSNTTSPMDYSSIEGYCVANYKEQPHMYFDEEK